MVVSPRNLPQRGMTAIVADRDGTLIGLLDSSSGDPHDRLHADGDFVWATFFVRDVQRAVPFYRELFGYTVTEDDRTAEVNDYILSRDDIPRASLAPLPADHAEARPGCLGFVRVADVEAVVARAIGLGAKVLIPPRAVEDGHQFAILADPLGAAVAVVSHPDNFEETP